MTERRSLEQQRLDGAVWAAEVRRGTSIADIARRHEVDESMVYRDIATAGYLLPALRAEVVPTDLTVAKLGTRPEWMRLSAPDIAFLHRVRDEIRAADRAAAMAEPPAQ